MMMGFSDVPVPDGLVTLRSVVGEGLTTLAVLVGCLAAFAVSFGKGEGAADEVAVWPKARLIPEAAGDTGWLLVGKVLPESSFAGPKVKVKGDTCFPSLCGWLAVGPVRGVPVAEGTIGAASVFGPSRNPDAAAAGPLPFSSGVVAGLVLSGTPAVGPPDGPEANGPWLGTAKVMEEAEVDAAPPPAPALSKAKEVVAGPSLLDLTSVAVFMAETVVVLSILIRPLVGSITGVEDWVGVNGKKAAAPPEARGVLEGRGAVLAS